MSIEDTMKFINTFHQWYRCEFADKTSNGMYCTLKEKRCSSHNCKEQMAKIESD